MTTPTINQLITAEAISQMLGVSRRQVWRLAGNGLLPGRIKIGRLTRWRRCDIQEWIDAGCPKQRR